MEVRSFPVWNQLVRRLVNRNSKRNRHGVNTQERRLRFEQCEQRSMLAVFTVNSIFDNGDGGNTTLRDAIDFANFSQELQDFVKFDETVFASGGTILLTQGQLNITESN